MEEKLKISLVLLPGLVCDDAVWADQITALSPVADCLVADYGDIDSLGAMAEHVLSIAPKQFALAGHSMGGRVAFEIMRRAPERVTKLALMDTRMHARPDGELGDKEAAGRYELLGIARTQGMRAMGTQWVQGMVHPGRLNDEALIAAILDMIERKTPAIFEAQIHALLNRLDAAEVLAAVRVPLLVLCGRDDAWSPLHWHEQMAQTIPGARLVAIDQCGHMATMERPAEVSAALLEWLA